MYDICSIVKHLEDIVVVIIIMGFSCLPTTNKRTQVQYSHCTQYDKNIKKKIQKKHFH